MTGLRRATHVHSSLAADIKGSKECSATRILIYRYNGRFVSLWLVWDWARHSFVESNLGGLGSEGHNIQVAEPVRLPGAAAAATAVAAATAAAAAAAAAATGAAAPVERGQQATAAAPLPDGPGVAPTTAGA